MSRTVAKPDWICGHTLSTNDLVELRAIRLLQRAALPVVPPAQMKPQDFLEHMAVDKKVLDGRLRLVLLRRMGEAVVTGDFPRNVLETTLSASICAKSSGYIGRRHIRLNVIFRRRSGFYHVWQVFKLRRRRIYIAKVVIVIHWLKLRQTSHRVD